MEVEDSLDAADTASVCSSSAGVVWLALASLSRKVSFHVPRKKKG